MPGLDTGSKPGQMGRVLNVGARARSGGGCWIWASLPRDDGDDTWRALGDPIELCLRGYELSIRKADAKILKWNASVKFVESTEEKRKRSGAAVWKRPRFRACRQPEQREDDALQPAHRQPAEGRELARRHR